MSSILCEMQFPWLQKMLLILHKITFHENEAAYLCVTMRKRASGIRAIICHIKFWHIYDIVENKFLYEKWSMPHGLSRDASEMSK